ncbi:LppX_LprAFG lipoprotein [Nocardioides jishulii]|uniref:LppX_LprAFG lipoprotein n=1 Tax=Nocardioides jishulii TaxID=2575440 RepID=A0A4U2YLC6_9ACTN|nr:LppX_LprAFG lipoprotein [Nocardioides jishulii]QCX27243.1 LppX_LprAFG lipoprotein [Nocardioides jishulii]TKI61730.1 LppX_LprAFG lipoprotein [Nocardioides jishulii]
MRGVRVRTRLAATLVVLALGASACSGGDDDGDRDPAQALSEAAETLESTSGVTLGLSTDELPSGVNGIVEAVGAVTDAPAFEGTLKVRVAGTDFDVPVVALDDKVWATVPLTTTWQDIDPTDYGAPDPSRLIGAENGVVALLRGTEDPEAGASERGGRDNDEVLTSYTGTIPGEVVKRVIPSSSASSEFDATYLVTDDGELRRAEVTGVFYEGNDEMTYVLDITDYGLEKTIRKP